MLRCALLFSTVLAVSAQHWKNGKQNTAWSDFSPNVPRRSSLREQAELARDLDHDNASIQVLGFKTEKSKLQSEIARLQNEVAGLTPQNAAQASAAMEQQDIGAAADLAKLNTNAAAAEQRLQQQAALQSMWQSTEREQAQAQAQQAAAASHRQPSIRGAPRHFGQPHGHGRWASRPPMGGAPPPGGGGGGGGGHPMLWLLVLGGGGFFLYKKQVEAQRHTGYGEINAGASSFSLGATPAAVAPTSSASATSGDGPGL
jgi:hypothetical protein